MSVGDQIRWLSTYDRQTGSLSAHAADNCGYGDLLRAGYVVNRGTMEMPDLFITATGKDVVEIYSMPVLREHVVRAEGN